MPPRLSCPGGWNSLLTGCRLKWPKGSGRNPMRIFFILLLWAAGSWTVWAAEPGEAAVVIYNAQKLERTTVRYAVLCYGVPLRIAEDPSRSEPGEEKLAAPLHRNGAAVDSELCLLPFPDTHRLLAGPLFNPFYDATNSASLNPLNGILMVGRLDGPDAAIARALVDKAMDAETNGLWGRPTSICGALRASLPRETTG